MPLTDTTVRNLKSAEKTYRVSDEKGMFIEVTPSGGKLWRIKYRFEGKQKPLALGKYPEVNLKEARERRDEARKLLANGVDPGEVRKEEKAAKEEAIQNTFARIAEEWFLAWRDGKASSTVSHTRARLDQYILPALGGLSIAELEAPDVLVVLRPVEGPRGIPYTAKRVNGNISQILQYAIATGRRKLADPCPALKTVLKTHTKKHFASFTKPADVARLLQAIDSHANNPNTSIFVSAALKLLPLLFCRPGELIAMKWSDIDLNKAEWTYTVSKTKTDHLVPLARQAIEILRSLAQYRFDDADEYVFPNRNKSRAGRHMSNMAINRALQDMGFDTQEEITGHGFRSMARTILDEELLFPPQVIEHQLAHKAPGPLGNTYNRTKYLPQRKKMMQRWADYLDGLKNED